MAAKTYIPQLVNDLQKAQKYATRYNPQLQARLTSDQIACLTSTITAIQACLKVIQKPPKE